MNAWLARAIVVGICAVAVFAAIPVERKELFLVEQSCRSQQADQRAFRECLQNRLTITLEHRGPSTLLKTVAALLSTDRMPVTMCHPILHRLGNVALERSGNVRTALQVDQGEICAAGYFHGVLEGAFAATNEGAGEICKNAGLTEIVPMTNCNHGLGHALLVQNNYDLPRTLAACDEIEPSWAVHCFNGAFMENSSPSHGQSKWLKADDPFYPCNSLDPNFRRECYAYVHYPLLRETNDDFAAALIRCSQLADPDAGYCIRGVANNLGHKVATRDHPMSQAIAACTTSSNRFPDQCLQDAASTIVYQHAALAEAGRFCLLAPKDFQANCFLKSARVGSQFPQVTQRQRDAFCAQLPVSEKRFECLRIAGQSTRIQ